MTSDAILEKYGHYDRVCSCDCGGRYCASNRKSLDNPNRKHTKGEKVEILQRRQRFHAARAQASTLEGATRRYQQWTGPELELVERTDLTAREVALMTGRTLRGVFNMRAKLRNDPRKQRVLDMHKPARISAGTADDE